MEILSTILSYAGYGVAIFFGFLFLIFAVAIIFGNNIKKDWEYEAKFFINRKEVGELDIEYSMIEKKEEKKHFKASFHLKHNDLKLNNSIQVFLDDLLILEGTVMKPGKASLGKNNIVAQVSEAPENYKECVVKCAGNTLIKGELYVD